MTTLKNILLVVGLFVVGCLFLGGCNGENLKLTLVEAEAGRINPALPLVQSENNQDRDGNKKSNLTFGAVEKSYHDPSRVARD